MRALFAGSIIFAFLASPVMAQTAVQGLALAPVVSAAAEATHVLKATPGTLYHIHAENATSTVGYVVVTNTTTAATTGTVVPLLCARLPVSAGVDIAFEQPGMFFSTGISVTLSSNASCFSITTGTITGQITAIVQ